MTLNISARQTKITIGGKDFTPCLLLIKGADKHIDQSGLVSVQGQITLGKSQGFDESLDDRKNPRFYRGQQIIVTIPDESGIYRRHPRGALRILEARYDNTSRRLILEIADLIGLLNFKEPTDYEVTEIQLGQPKSTADIIINLLAKAGINNIAGALPNTNLNYDINLSGSYLNSIGKLLYSNNLFGWIDKDEIFRIEEATISGSAPQITVHVGMNEVFYQRLNGAEAPCEKIKAVGRGVCVVESPDYSEDISEQFGSAISVDKDAGYSQIVIRRTKITESWDGQRTKLKKEIIIEQPVGMIIPSSLISPSESKIRLMVASATSETINYEGSDIIFSEDNLREQIGEGKLLSKKKFVLEPQVSSIAEFMETNQNYFANLYSLIEAANSVEKWTYDRKDQQAKITKLARETNGKILSGTDEDWDKWLFTPTDLVVSEIREDKWEEYPKGTWTYEFTTLNPLIRVKPDLAEVRSTNPGTAGPDSNKLDLIYGNSERNTSSSGQYQPPAAERRPARYTKEEKNLEEVVFFPISASEFRPRERVFSVDFLAGEFKKAPGKGSSIGGGGFAAARQQLQNIARREGALLLGRFKGQEVGTGLVDGWFNYRPLMSVQCVEPDGTAMCFLVDGAAWTLDQSRAIVSFDGIWVGTYPASATPEIAVIPAFPSISPFTGGVGVGGTATALPYAVAETVVSTSPGGVGVGGSADTDEISWLSLTLSQWLSLSFDDWKKVVF